MLSAVRRNQRSGERVYQGIYAMISKLTDTYMVQGTPVVRQITYILISTSCIMIGSLQPRPICGDFIHIRSTPDPPSIRSAGWLSVVRNSASTNHHQVILKRGERRIYSNFRLCPLAMYDFMGRWVYTLSTIGPEDIRQINLKTNHSLPTSI